MIEDQALHAAEPGGEYVTESVEVHSTKRRVHRTVNKRSRAESSLFSSRILSENELMGHPVVVGYSFAMTDLKVTVSNFTFYDGSARPGDFLRQCRRLAKLDGVPDEKPCAIIAARCKGVAL